MISFKLKNKCYRPIGLDIGHDSVKMIQFAINDDCVTVTAASKIAIDNRLYEDNAKYQQFIVSSIDKMLASGNFTGKNVVSCLAGDDVKMTSLRLNENERLQADTVLKKEMADRFDFDLDEDQINYLDAGNVKHGDDIKTEYLMFAAYNEVIKNHINMLESCGLRPVSIDLLPCALFRSFGRSLRRTEDIERTSVFVDVGSKFTTVVFGRRGQINFVKQIPVGSESFNQQIASKLNVNLVEADILRSRLQKERRFRDNSQIENKLDASSRQVLIDAIGAVAEQLAREVSLCFKYYTVTFRGKRIENVIITGGGAYESILIAAFKRHLAVDIEIAKPLKGFEILNGVLGNEGTKPCSEWAVAVGLGMKGYDLSKCKN